MAQLNLYVPDRIMTELKAKAKKQKKSLSAYVSDSLALQTDKSQWNGDFFKKVAGGWKGDFPPVDRPVPEEREFL